MFLEKYAKKIAAVLSVALIAGCVTDNLLGVDAATEYADEIVLPLTLIDYNADNLLFQYDLYDSIGKNFTFTTETFTGAVGATRVPLKEGDADYYTQGLVEDTLNPTTGAPLYKHAVVEEVARMVQAQLVKPTTADDTTNFLALQSKLVTTDPTAINMQEMTHSNLTKRTYYFYDLGWKIQGTGYTQENGEIKNSSGDLIWRQETDGILYYGNGDAGDVLVKEVTGLDASKEHSIRTWKTPGTVGVGLQVYSGNTLITESYTGEAKTFNKDSDVNRYSDVTLKIVPKAGSITAGEKIAAVHIVEISKTVSGSDVISTEEFVQNNILNIQEKVSFDNSGWNALNPGSYSVSENALCDANGEKRWVFEGDGLEPWGAKEPVYKDVQLRAGKDYLITYLGASEGTVSIYSGYSTSTEIASDIHNGELFTVPADGDGKIRIVYQSSGEEYAPYAQDPQWWERNKLAKLALMEVNCTLGTYAESEAKYADESKGFDDIASCMDYAYYMLNNVFVSETDTNKTPYDGFKTITLTHAGNGVYEFVADISDWTTDDERYEVIYDTVTKDIRNDRANAYTGEGLFPLDGVPSDEGTYVSDMTKNQHNYHYALSSHSYFYYDENEDLFFEFTGDDDVYLFINNKLALDLGGAHLAANKKINLNDMKTQLGLEDGKVYEFDFFYLERHTDFSNFYVNTNIQLLDAGKLSLNFYQDNKLLEAGSTVEKDSEVELEYQMDAYVNGLKELQFSDKTLGIEIGVNGFRNTKDTKVSEEGIRITVYNEDGTVKETKTFEPSQSAEISTFFSGLTLNLREKVTVRGILYQATDKLDSEVSVTYSSPRYAGATGDMVSNTSDAAGIIDVKEQPKTTEYTIQYYIDGETIPFKETTGTGVVGDEVKRDESVTSDGYQYNRTNMTGDVLKLVEDKGQNVLKVYFVKDTPTENLPVTPTTVSYTIQYYRDGETTPFVTTTGKGNVGADISRDTGVTLAGYRYDRTNIQGDVLKLVADSNSNVLKVYYVKEPTTGGNTQTNPPAQITTIPSNNNSEAVINTTNGSATTAVPLTDDTLPRRLTLVVILLGLAGLCFRVSRLGKEEWD